jgi:hypothetical protein
LFLSLSEDGAVVAEDGAVAAVVVVAVMDCSEHVAVAVSSEAESWPLAINLVGGLTVMRMNKDICLRICLFWGVVGCVMWFVVCLEIGANKNTLGLAYIILLCIHSVWRQ